MINLLSHTGNVPYIGHFQGNAMKNYTDIVEEFSSKAVSITPRISVITAFNKKENAIAALQLELSSASYTNACTNFEKEWNNVDKIGYYVEELSKTTSEYTLLVDANDVIFFKNLDDDFIQKFESMNKKIIFNATKNNHPNFELDKVENRDALGEFKYLNAGVVFGRTEDLLAFYKEALENSKRKDIMNPWKSEQLFIRMTANGKEYVGFDYQCVLFQTFSKTKRTACGNTVIIV